MGAWGKASEDVHETIDYLDEARLKHQKLLEGRWRLEKKSDETAVAAFKGRIRKKPSLQAVRSQARNFQDQLGNLGAGAAAAARRRRWAEQGECRMGKERRAYHICLSRVPHM